MITIVEPQKDIIKLWGKQKLEEDKKYRLMKYVFRVKENDKIALHNVVSGQLIILSHEEEILLEKNPVLYTSALKELIEAKFLVAEDYDECRLVINLRKILKKLNENAKAPVSSYSIIPTTACNARCYYCFEAGAQIISMSEQTASEVVDYICNNCGSKKKIHITWFGGEPTVAVARIDQICLELNKRNVEFSSVMYSNGYLFDEDLVEKAKNLWKLDSIQIVVDGTGDNYKRIKNYQNIKENPYERVLNNISLLVQNRIFVTVRTNIDKNNYKDHKNLQDDLAKRFSGNKYLDTYLFPVVGEYPEDDGEVYHGNAEWMREVICELNERCRNLNIQHVSHTLPSLRYIGCMADNDKCLVINPKGEFCKCLEQFEKDTIIGDVVHGFSNEEYKKSWKVEQENQMCYECVLFPKCIRLANCSAHSSCYQYDKERQLELSILYNIKNKGGGRDGI